MTSSSTILINNITVLDHAVFLPAKRSKDRPYCNRPPILGNSIAIHAVITGSLNGEEQVVADFSSIKSQIKKLIDDPAIGFDHKLLVLTSDYFDTPPVIALANCGIVKAGSDGLLNDHDSSSSGLRFLTPYVMSKPDYYLEQFERTGGLKAFNDDLCVELSEFLNTHLKSAGANVEVAIRYDDNVVKGITVEGGTFFSAFRYTHGLPKSSSWGCRNLFHGHASGIYLYSDPDTWGHSTVPVSDKIRRLSTRIASDIMDCHFVSKDWIDVTCLEIGYDDDDCDRGDWQFNITDCPSYIIVLDSEPTIENIILYLANKYEAELVECNVTHMYVTEGLWKGALHSIAKSNKAGVK